MGQSYAKLVGSTDTAAVHVNVAGEIEKITEKGTPVSADLLVIEDSADSGNKKRVQVGNLPGGGGGTTVQVDTGGGLGAADFQDGGDINFAEAAGVVTATIKTDTVTYDKMQDATQTDIFLGRDTAGAGTIEEIDATAARGILNVENGSTADQTGAEIKTAYEGENFKAYALLANNTAGAAGPTEIDASDVAEDATPTSGNKLLGFQSGAVGAVLQVFDVGNLPAGGEINNLSGDGISGIADDQLAVGTGAGTAAYQTLPNGVVKYDTGAGTFSLGTEGGAGTDTTAIHDDTAGEIAAVTLKASPVSGDFLLIEDSAAANAKKRVTIGSLPAGSEANNLAGDGVSGIADDQIVVGSGAGTAAYHTLPNGAVTYATATNTVSQAASTDLSDVTGSTGTGSTMVFDTSPTIVTPTIASMTNAQHNHQDAAGGGTLSHNSATDNPTVAHGATGAVMGTTNTQTVTNKDLTDQTNKLHFSKGITLETPADGDRIVIAMNERAWTITGVSFSSVDGTSVLFNVEYATTIASGTVIHTDTCASSTPEWDVTPSGTTAVPTNQIITIEITTVTGSVTQFHVTIEGDHT